MLQSLLALSFEEMLIELKVARSELLAQIKRLEGLIYMDEDDKYRLTKKGLETAQSMI